jgi:uncharacterized membrane protein
VVQSVYSVTLCRNRTSRLFLLSLLLLLCLFKKNAFTAMFLVHSVNFSEIVVLQRPSRSVMDNRDPAEGAAVEDATRDQKWQMWLLFSFQ